MTQEETVKELHFLVRQHFVQHQFETFGDALKWWHEASYEEQVAESGSLGISLFSSEILWAIAQLGPQHVLDYEIMKIK